MSPAYRILDLDNCAADDGWRINRINWQKTGNPRYHEYHLLCGFDRLVNDHLAFPSTGERLIILTGRPNLVRGITDEWLRRHEIRYDHMLMRNNDDERQSHDVKETQLMWLETLYDIELHRVTSAFDDRPEIIAMYAEHGIPGEVVTAHGLDAYTNPNQLKRVA